MTSRERARRALNHQAVDRPPIDLGATSVTGIAAQALAHLRVALGLPGPARVRDPMLLLGEVEEAVRQALGVDFVGASAPGTKYGFLPEGEQPFRLADGTEALIAGNFRYTQDAAGNRYAYPQNDTSLPPCAVMPAGGHYFDPVIRQEPVDEERLDGRRDFAAQFRPVSEASLRAVEARCDQLYRHTEYALVGNFGGMGLGDAAHMPGPALRSAPGIREMSQWMMAHLLYPNYVHDVYALQTEIALQNLERYRQAVGDRILVLNVSGTDFGTQRSELLSPDLFREFYKPYYRRVNDWVHAHTGWKTFYHSCGSIPNLLEDFVEMGCDIINPVQCSAAGMEPEGLKRRFGGRLVFWGGGVDTQSVLPFGSPGEVEAQARERIRILGQGGGYVFSAIHNIQADTPPENVLALFRAAGGVQ